MVEFFQFCSVQTRITLNNANVIDAMLVFTFVLLPHSRECCTSDSSSKIYNSYVVKSHTISIFLCVQKYRQNPKLQFHRILHT